MIIWPCRNCCWTSQLSNEWQKPRRVWWGNAAQTSVYRLGNPDLCWVELSGTSSVHPLGWFHGNIKALFHSIGRSVRLDRTQFRLIWRRTLGPRTSFHSKQIRRTPNPRLLWSQSMVRAEPVFPEMATISGSWLQKKVNSLFNSFTTGCLSFQCNFVLLVERILL